MHYPCIPPDIVDKLRVELERSFLEIEAMGKTTIADYNKWVYERIKQLRGLWIGPIGCMSVSLEEKILKNWKRAFTGRMASQENPQIHSSRPPEMPLGEGT